MDQVDSGHATDPGIADDEIAHNYLVLVGNDDVPADEAGGAGTHCGDLGPGRHPRVAG